MISQVSTRARLFLRRVSEYRRIAKFQPRWGADGGNGFVVYREDMTTDPIRIIDAYAALLTALARIDEVLRETHTEQLKLLRDIKENGSRSETN